MPEITIPERLTDEQLTQLYSNNPEWIAKDKAVKEAQERLEQLKQSDAMPDTAELKEAKQVLSQSVHELNIILARKVLIERNEARIKELEEQLRSQSEELAEIEGIEFTIAAFCKARVEAVERCINSKFRLVRFKMYEQQINGGETETCEAMVDGVPYSSLNNAMQVNAGIDIINALAQAEGVCAPIFIDNAESVQQLEATHSQVVRLVVADCALSVDNQPKDLFSNI